MNARSPRSPRSGGALLAAAILVGAVGGSFAGEPSIGFLVGLAAGLALLAIIWLIDRRKV